MNFIKAISILIGTVIGAGIFSLPFAFSKSGLLIGILYLFLFFIVLLIGKFCYAELILRTEDELEMPGYASRYLGKSGKILITTSLVLGIYAALTAYIIGVGEFLDLVLSPLVGGSPFIWSLIFWGIASLIVLIGINIISRLEMFMSLAIIFIVFFIFILTYSHIDINNLKIINFDNMFFPYGIVLFALGGATAIPIMRKILKDQVKLLLKPAIAIGLMVPVLVYIIFSISIMGVTGVDTTETAITGLKNIVDQRIILVGGIFGILAMSTSYLALAYVLRRLFQVDYKVPLLLSWILTISIPIILFITGLKSFVAVIGFSGGILAGLQSIILIKSYYKAKKTGDRQPEFSFNLPKPFAYIIYLIFIIGIIYQFVYFF